ncbi:hypothetical protein M9H77_35538 [Catharanthus roseus]|uniref:Uncharacterized protein n=1 Tax=Catharanthus roseus TaxID=4058 RepID=A0ACB9ZPM0_CATRO|nr:hypothetical protein M9H77_35538 [Catharanthus roseus]
MGKNYQSLSPDFRPDGRKWLAARPTEEQLYQTEQFRKSHVPPRNILRFFREQDVGCTVSAQKIYNVIAKIKRNRMLGRNTVEEVLCLSIERSNVLSDIVVAHPTSIAMIRTWPYVLITDTTYKTNKDDSDRKELHSGNNFYVLYILHLLCQMARVQLSINEHSVLKVWLSTCHGDLDTVFLNIDSLIQRQIKIMDELKKAREMVEELGSNCLHYLRKSHSLPCACELVHRRLEINSDIPEQHDRDMDSEMSDLTLLIHEISNYPISKVREVRRLIKGVISPVLPEDHCQPLTTPSETAITRGRRKTNSTKRDKSHWEYVSVAHRKIEKSSGSSSGSGSGSGSGFGPSPRGRGRLPHRGRGRGRGPNSGRSSLSCVVNPNAPSTPFPFNNAFLGSIYECILNWKNVVGDGNCGFRAVSNFLFGDENHWVEIRRRMCFDLHHHMNLYVQLFASVERVTELIRQTNWEEGSAPADYWKDTPDHLYVIANTFNL